jgi:hypothetical protein
VIEAAAAPLCPATVVETLPVSWDLRYGSEKVPETAIAAERLQRVERVHISRVCLFAAAADKEALRAALQNLAPAKLRQRALAAEVPAEVVRDALADSARRPALVDAVVEAETVPIPAEEAAQQSDAEAMHAAPLAAPSKTGMLTQGVPGSRPAPLASRLHRISYPLPIEFAWDLMEVTYILPPWLSESYHPRSKTDPFDFLTPGLEVLVLPERQHRGGAASRETVAEQLREAFRAAVTPTAPAQRSMGGTVEVRYGLNARRSCSEEQARLLKGTLPAKPLQDGTRVLVRPSAGGAPQLAALNLSASSHGQYAVDHLPCGAVAATTSTLVKTDVSLVGDIAPGDCIRLADNHPSTTREVADVTPFGLELREPWGRDSGCRMAIFKMDCHCQKKDFVDELVGADKLQRGEQDQDINESGFQAVQKLMRGDTKSIAPCSICLEEPTNGGVAVTQCCHVRCTPPPQRATVRGNRSPPLAAAPPQIFCKECVVSLIESANRGAEGQAAKCPVCRKVRGDVANTPLVLTLRRR